MDEKTVNRELIKSFFLAFKRLSLYAAEHPLSRDILKNLYKIFTAILEDVPEILIVIGAGRTEIFVNEALIEPDTLGAFEVHEKFELLKIDGLAFTRGLTYEEVVALVVALAKAASRDAGQAVDVPEIFQKGSAHIGIRKIRYEKVEDGEQIVARGRAAGPGPGAGPGPVAGVSGEAVLDDIRVFLSGAGGEIHSRAEEVFEELEHDLTGVTQAIIESAQKSGDFEGVIRRLVAWMSHHVVPIVVERKHDPARFIQRLFDSFGKQESLSAFSGVQEVVASCADDIMVAMVEASYRAYAESPRKALLQVAKILADEEDQARILPKFVGKLTAEGVPAASLDGFVKTVEGELARDEEVPISKKKLAKLMRLSERFEDEVDHRVRRATEKLLRANQRLADEKERSEGVMRYLADGLVVVDKSGRVVMMNPAAEKLLATDAKGTIGRSLAENIKEEHLLAMARPGEDGPGPEGHITKEIELKSKDEETKRILKASSAVVENEDGKAVGMVTVLSDITRQKELEEVKSNFVSLVTHELRTPVVAIQKSIELILSQATGAINEDQQRFLSISKFNIERMNKLINDLLDMSKLEAGKFVLHPGVFDLAETIREAKASLTSWAKDKHIEVTLELGEGPLEIKGDRDRLIQVLVNLIGNALKFTPAEGRVNVSLIRLDKKEGVSDGPCVQVVVTDTGIGVDPKDAKRIFNKFEQVSLVAPQGVGGTGLGLPISKEIIALHGGAIWVESQPGAGSRFIFVIPQGTLQKT